MKNKDPYIRELFHKYFRDECNKTELRIIYDWLSNPTNQLEFYSILDNYLKDTNSLESNDIARISSWENIKKHIEEKEVVVEQSLKKQWSNFRKVAAIFIFILVAAMVYLFSDQIVSEKPHLVEKKSVIIKKEIYLPVYLQDLSTR